MCRPTEVTWDTGLGWDRSGQACRAGRSEFADSRSTTLRIFIVTSAQWPWAATNHHMSHIPPRPGSQGQGQAGEAFSGPQGAACPLLSLAPADAVASGQKACKLSSPKWWLCNRSAKLLGTESRSGGRRLRGLRTGRFQRHRIAAWSRQDARASSSPRGTHGAPPCRRPASCPQTVTLAAGLVCSPRPPASFLRSRGLRGRPGKGVPAGTGREASFTQTRSEATEHAGEPRGLPLWKQNPHQTANN